MNYEEMRSLIEGCEALADELQRFVDSGQPAPTEWMLRVLRHLGRLDRAEWFSPEAAAFVKDHNAKIRQLIPSIKLQ